MNAIKTLSVCCPVLAFRNSTCFIQTRQDAPTSNYQTKIYIGHTCK